MLILSRRVSLCFGLAFLAAVMVSPTMGFAQETEKVNTVMTVSEMCGGCVNKITKRFEGVDGIENVICDIATQKVTVVPKSGISLSPRGVWEIMEEISKTPKKMVCPSGTFTTKPTN